MSTDSVNPTNDNPALAVESGASMQSDDDTDQLQWDDALPPIFTSDGRYGLLHRDLIWDCLGPGEDGSLAPGPDQREPGVDRDDRYLLHAMPITERDSRVAEDMDFDAIDPAFVASMGLQPYAPESEDAPESSASADGNRPVSPVVVENTPVATDDQWWLHPDDERIDAEVLKKQ